MSIAFKEWAIVCAALGRGEQSIILRKGGIAEGRDGFSFKHEEFYLFPTLFHEQIEKTRLPLETPIPAMPPGMIRIDLLARVEWTATITDLDVARRLAPFHVWNEAVVEERFRYDDAPGIHLAFLRIRRLAHPCVFPEAPKYGGCRSWVTIPDVPGETGASPVLDDGTHRMRSEELQRLVGAGTGAKAEVEA